MKFRMVDRILSWDPERGIRGVKAVSFEEYSLKEPFGGPAALPESLLLQSAFELGAWLLIFSSDFKEGGAAMGWEEAKFVTPVGPGERVLLEVTARADGGGDLLLDATGKVGEREAFYARGLGLRRIPLSELGDPEDYRTLASEIGGLDRAGGS